MTMTHRENIPFFSTLPPKAVKAATRLWDASHDPAYNGAQAYSDFVQDLTFAGISAPPRAVVKRWLAGVQAGLIERPEPLDTAAPADDPQAEVAPVKPRRGRAPRQPADEEFSRPVPEDARPSPIAETAFEKLTPATFGGTVFSSLIEAGIAPPEPDDERPDPALALVTRQMVEEEVARINVNVRAQATANVAARLRQMAASLDSSNAA